MRLFQKFIFSRYYINYSLMAYSRFPRSGLRRRGFKKVAVGAKPKRTYAPKKKYPMVSFNQRVNALIARNVENKKTPAAQAVAPVCAINSLGAITWYVLKDWHTNVWKIPQGAGQAQRIGNKLKMKKWIIKGQIIPDYPGINFSENVYLNHSYQGYITLFFGRRHDIGAIDGSLFQLLDNGSSSLSPAGSSTEMMLPINKEVYKVYWKKTFKMGASYGQNSSSNQSPNNDFNLTRTFGFDVCKHIFKNRILQFNDTDQQASDRDLQRVAVWAIWRPAISSLYNPSIGVQTRNSFYNINLTSYGEYEDA